MNNFAGNHHRKQQNMLNSVFSICHMRDSINVFYPTMHEVFPILLIFFDFQLDTVFFPPLALPVCHVKHKFKKNHTKIIQKATIFQSPTQQAYLITLKILYYEIDRKTVLLVISLLKSFIQTIAKSLK